MTTTFPMFYTMYKTLEKLILEKLYIKNGKVS